MQKIILGAALNALKLWAAFANRASARQARFLGCPSNKASEVEAFVALQVNRF
jgi:hypothetical protein